MAKQTIPSNWKNCASCARWGGTRRPADPFQCNVEFDNSQKGKCYGKGYNQVDMQPMASCNSWEPQYRK